MLAPALSTERERFNRTERLRRIPADTRAGRRLKDFRQDSEVPRSRFDRSCARERVPADGPEVALLAPIGCAWLSNSVARPKIHPRARRLSRCARLSSLGSDTTRYTDRGGYALTAATTTCRQAGLSGPPISVDFSDTFSDRSPPS